MDTSAIDAISAADGVSAFLPVSLASAASRPQGVWSSEPPDSCLLDDAVPRQDRESRYRDTNMGSIAGDRRPPA